MGTQTQTGCSSWRRERKGIDPTFKSLIITPKQGGKWGLELVDSLSKLKALACKESVPMYL